MQDYGYEILVLTVTTHFLRFGASSSVMHVLCEDTGGVEETTRVDACCNPKGPNA